MVVASISYLNTNIDHVIILLYRTYKNDKLLLKVDEGSDALLMLAGLIPDFVSQNETEGKIECAQFFPAGYKNGVEEELEEVEVVDGDGDKVENDCENENQDENETGKENVEEKESEEDGGKEDDAVELTEVNDVEQPVENP